jgi:hypothetical protein
MAGATAPAVFFGGRGLRLEPRACPERSEGRATESAALDFPVTALCLFTACVSFCTS